MIKQRIEDFDWFIFSWRRLGSSMILDKMGDHDCVILRWVQLQNMLNFFEMTTYTNWYLPIVIYLLAGKIQMSLLTFQWHSNLNVYSLPSTQLWLQHIWLCLCVSHLTESLSGARVLVTGASTGIGEQMAYHYARFGAQIVITARREKVLQQVSELDNISMAWGVLCPSCHVQCIHRNWEGHNTIHCVWLYVNNWHSSVVWSARIKLQVFSILLFGTALDS